MEPIKTALLSYGMSGKVFHAPFISIHPGFVLTGAWERSRQLIQKDHPSARSYPSLEAVLKSDAAVIVVNTPNHTHFEYAKEALLAGKHVIVEKAFTTTVKEAEELKAIAGQEGKKIGVFHNRRWDSDFKTVQKVVEEGWLGNITEAEFHFDRYKPVPGPKQHKEVPGPGAGILKDLGPHLIDQALYLFGKPQAVFADIRITRPLSQVDDWFDILLYYPDMRVHLKAGFLVKEPVPAYVLHGSKGSFLKARGDIQEANLMAGLKPGSPGWGTEPEIAQGLLHIEKDGHTIYEKIPSLKGDYYEYYQQVYEALTTDRPMPVTADDGIRVMEVIGAAADSNREKKVIWL